MLKAFQKQISEHFSILDEERFLLACSGGVDSMVLAALCARANLKFAMAHCNFRLRGTESDADEDLVRKTASKYKVDFYITHFDTVGYVNKNKVSVQMAARELRYTWFTQIMDENTLGALVTAHHADDNLETFLINLSRGTGIEGLTGIPPKNGNIYRPLLSFSREQIEAYARTERIEWREDASNAETKYLRNRIRHQIVPELKKLNPTFLENFKKTQEHLSGTAAFLNATIEKLKTSLFVNNNGVVTISIADLLELHPLKTVLYELFKEFGFTAWDDINALLTASSGKEVRSKTHRLVKDRDTLLLAEIKESARNIYAINVPQKRIDRPITLLFDDVSEIDETSGNVLYVDKETLKYPLTVRKWQKGDYFYPLGMQGKKKLSKYFKDEKVDIIAKDDQWLLFSGNDLVWVIGRRGDDRFKVNAHTKQIVKIIFNK
ncbi:tRNA lysidine(34) synthetase TilS [Aggregatimonas sangjinii]|uniref:tRNA(Ile)-lysidine synthase n=1 Tax=Aggregatimonas sangjinii TaxID=2583587 RepID=A0A5B7STQ3_9FLAO|nr:tRNA lysidine(34) synthetase TilS [Aggregatimonas sangjinii]QCX00094.1 tRNA lysidine(34) synthetase TilS [Aggregatimonas sangjinii]